MIEPNYRYRAISTNVDERRAVDEAFAKSVLWGFTVAAESSGRVLVDATEFLLRDVHNVTQRLRPATYRVDRSRSAVNMERTKVFPKNTEIDVVLTFVNEGGQEAQAGGGLPGGRLTDVTPRKSPALISLSAMGCANTMFVFSVTCSSTAASRGFGLNTDSHDAASSSDLA